METLQKVLRHTDLMLGIGLMIVVAMLILPLPHWMLDAGLVLAIASSVIVLLSSVNVDDPLKFSVFPSLLLITTLYRLALSIAATKLILGTGDGGRVIATFGNFVLGGDFVVGFVAFLILMVVQFIVITNGAGRVSEVTARFTLDAMPGKQMAIDADLAAGLINEGQARERRKAVKREADFYGAMDGASKFVKGDAIASLLIIVINIIGGFGVGFFRGEGDAMTILHSYALLSVGEGLVSQIPALLISTASGLLVTRAGQERSMGGEVLSQVMGQPRAMGAAGGALMAFGLVPGFPLTIFFGMGLGLIAMSRLAAKHGDKIATALAPVVPVDPQATPPAPEINPNSTEALLPLIQVDALEIEIGFSLTRIADPRVGGDLPDRVAATRRQIALELGFVMPSVRIRDSVALQPNEYAIKVRGEEVARSTVHPDKLLAMGDRDLPNPVIGEPTTEPVFGLDAVWIDPILRDQADSSGYTIIEPSAVIATHLSETVRTYAAEILSRQDVQNLVDSVKSVNSTVVDELIPGRLTVGQVQKVLQHLLRERIPIRDMVTILETLADFVNRTEDPDQLGELVRAAISRTITRQHLDHENKIYCLALDPATERALSDCLQNTTLGQVLVMEPNAQNNLVTQIQQEFDMAVAIGHQPVLLCGNSLRLPLQRLLSRYAKGINVLAYNEVSARAEVEIIGAVKHAA
ncbi:MAG: flagellar biosynthesis protein FlhA [Armatimonadetes bacterium]|nr:flagellar biosynthesis protein FlhA [Armatimonadota bacterium]